MADRTKPTRVLRGVMPLLLLSCLLLSGCETDNTTPRTRLPHIDEPAPPPPQIVTPVPPAQPDRYRDDTATQPKETTK